MSNWSSFPPIGWDEETDTFDHTALTYVGPMPSLTDPPGGLDLAEIVGDDWLRLHVWSKDGEATVVLTEAAARVLAGQLQQFLDR